MGALTFDKPNPWRIQTTDPDEEGYYGEAEAFVADVDSAIEKSVLEHPIVVYRGLNDDVLGEAVVAEAYQEDRPIAREWLAKEFPVGEEIEFKLPQSSSHSISTAMRFAYSKIVLEVKAKKAAPVGVVSAWSAGEAEYLLPRTTKYRVVSVEEKVTYNTKTRDGEERERDIMVVQLEQL